MRVKKSHKYKLDKMARIVAQLKSKRGHYYRKWKDTWVAGVKSYLDKLSTLKGRAHKKSK
jgi:hypothetical protein